MGDWKDKELRERGGVEREQGRGKRRGETYRGQRAREGAREGERLRRDWEMKEGKEQVERNEGEGEVEEGQ
jgi:hypothetical protein